MTNNTEGRDGWIYFILSEYAIKIGFSTEPKRRLESLQVSTHHNLAILATVPTSLVTEREAHKHFAHLRIRGEWFRAERDLLKFIEALNGGRNLIREPEVEERISSEAGQLEQTRRELIVLRAAHGSESAMGYCCSNLIEQLQEMATYKRPDWASHECQTLPFMIGRQMKRLAELRAQNN